MDLAPEQAGWLKIYRKLTKNPVWTQLPPYVLKVMIGMLLRANWKEGKWYNGRNQVSVPVGSFITSYPDMAKFCNISVKECRTAQAHLERLEIASYTRARVGAGSYTMVTISNYKDYQSAEDTPGSQMGSHSGTIRAGYGHDMGTPRAGLYKEEEGKNLRSKEKTSCAPNGALDADAPHFDTLDGETQPAWDLKPTQVSTVPPNNRWFEEWYAIYPRKRARKNAETAYKRVVKNSASMRDELLGAIRKQLPYFLALKESGRAGAIPHPATWLNGERWLDEPEEPISSRPESEPHSARKSAAEIRLENA